MRLYDDSHVTIGIPCYALDGDNLRLGLSSDLGFDRNDAVESTRRAAEVSPLQLVSNTKVL